ncbi:MAG: carboxypeptidase-like regulatory domain-containing protein [Bacteroidales bacterium]
MKQLTLFISLILFFTFTTLAQTGSIRGKVIENRNANPLSEVNILVKGTNIEEFSKSNGEFLINHVPVGEGFLIFSLKDYKTKEIPFIVKENDLLEIGTITLEYAPDYKKEKDDLPMIVLDAGELEDNDIDQGIGGLLHSSDDIFASTAAYTFGAARFDIRGFGSENSTVFFNGIRMNNLETGRPYWSDWGGLNDATRNEELFYGMDNNKYSLTTLGSGSNIITKASEYSPGVKISYMNTNKYYNHRVMATASTGIMDNDWAITISGSRRWSQEGYVEGTYYDANAVLLAAEKIINDKHAISLTAFVTPNKRGKQIGSTQEAYDYLNDNYYNANWGYQAGEKRNARISNTFKPFIELNHYWDFNDKLKINSAVAYSFGRDGNTRLNWYDAADPRPNYYRYLPYYNRDVEDYTWDNQHVDWDFFYFANRKNLYTQEDVDGIEGNDVTFNRAKYMIEDQRIDHNQIIANTHLIYDLNDNIKLTGNINYNWYKGKHFKLVDDLLGADYWVDIDHFAERDFADPVIAQSDLDNPNRLVEEGDLFGYDFDANIQKIGGFVKGDYTMGKVDAYLGINLSNTSFYRTGNMRNGKFPDNSAGDSEKQSFFNYAFSGGATYKLTGRHIFTGNATYMTRAPFFENAYVSPRTRNVEVEGLTSEKIFSTDLNYIVRMPNLKGRITGYYSTFKDQVDVMSFYHDNYNSFVNYAMTGIDKKHFGTEIGLEYDITSTLSVQGVAAIGQYTYDSRPNVTITRDNDAETLGDPNQTVYVKNFYVDGTPQQAYSVGLSYNSPKYWWLEVNASYFDDIYLSFNPARRTTNAIVGLDPNSPYGAERIKEITQQEKLASQYTVDLSGGKSWKFGDYYLSIYANISNLLDNQEFITGGYEQLRFDYENQDVNKFSPVYYYMWGRTYMLILTLRF